MLIIFSSVFTDNYVMIDLMLHGVFLFEKALMGSGKGWKIFFLLWAISLDREELTFTEEAVNLSYI